MSSYLPHLKIVGRNVLILIKRINSCLQAEVKINICTLFTTRLFFLTHLDKYKHCLIQKIWNNWISGISRLCVLEALASHGVYVWDVNLMNEIPPKIVNLSVLEVWIEDGASAAQWHERCFTEQRLLLLKCDKLQ